MPVWVAITDVPVYMCDRGEGDGKSVDSESLSLLSYTLRYVRLADLDRHEKSVGAEALSLLSYTLRYISLEDLRQSHGLRQTMPVWVVITDEPVYMRE